MATALPTVFLRFKKVDNTWDNPDPVWIRVPYWDRANLPRTAEVFLDGSEEAVAKLKSSLTVSLAGKSYRLDPADARDLTPGVYVGIVVIGDRPLANLRIVVDDKPL